MTTKQDHGIEVIESEESDLASTPPAYKVVTFPADYTLEGIVTQCDKGRIVFPEFQRKFVWTQKQASRLIESFLLGLPVPAIFLYKDREERQNVIDGQQRLRSIVYFFKGSFGEEKRGKTTTFRLVGLNEKSPYLNRTYSELDAMDPPAFNRLNSAVLRSFVVQQLDPEDNSSIYHIFERLNTGGTLLVGQEIRNCVSAGPFNDLLKKLNRIELWRALFGKRAEDNRSRDVELILRFFALFRARSKYEKPMKTFLNNFMDKHRSPSRTELQEYERLFTETANCVHKTLGNRPFHIRAGLNAAVFDAVFVAFADGAKHIPSDILSRYQRLKRDKTFLERVTSSTTDKDAVSERLQIARSILFD